MDNLEDLPPPPPYSAYDPHRGPPDSTANTNPTLHLHNEEKAYQAQSREQLYISGAAYFAMHPFPDSQEFPLLIYRLPLLRDAMAASISFPGADSIMRERNLSRQDWHAFLSHLVLQQPGVGAGGTSRSSQNGDAPMENEYTRRARVDAVTHEWNEGFFEPRGLHIITDIELYSKFDSQLPNAALHRASSGQDPGKAMSDESAGLALYHAVSKGNATLAQTLLDSGANTNMRPSYAKPALTRAVENGDWHIVQMILERGRPDLEATAPAGETALYVTVTKGNENLVDLLLRRGANIRAKPPGGEPALYKATSRGFTKIVRLLCESPNIDVNATPPGGRPSLCLAYDKGNFEVVDLLLKKGANPNGKPSGGSTVMYKAAGKGDFENTRKFLEYGADPDATPPGGSTGLYNAASKGQEAIARVLMEYGADISIKASGQNSALWVAANMSNVAMARLLLERGAVVDAATFGGNTALWHAAKRGDLQIASLLLEYGANPDEKGMGQDTALMNAASKGNLHMARLLIDHGADPHKKVRSETPLSRAAKKGHRNVVEMMLDKSKSPRGPGSGYSRKA